MNKKRRKDLSLVISQIRSMIKEGEALHEGKLKNVECSLSELCDEEIEAIDNMPYNMFTSEKYQDMLDNMSDIQQADKAILDILNNIDDMSSAKCEETLQFAIANIERAINR